ncbi:MAG TPA: hypothetical protein VHC19_16785 [Pirellulales bacterium]|nr:hypothetical protein [Pirellulales bacterium]
MIEASVTVLIRRQEVGVLVARERATVFVFPEKRFRAQPQAASSLLGDWKRVLQQWQHGRIKRVASDLEASCSKRGLPTAGARDVEAIGTTTVCDPSRARRVRPTLLVKRGSLHAKVPIGVVDGRVKGLLVFSAAFGAHKLRRVFIVECERGIGTKDANRFNAATVGVAAYWRAIRLELRCDLSAEDGRLAPRLASAKPAKVFEQHRQQRLLALR